MYGSHDNHNQYGHNYGGQPNGPNYNGAQPYAQPHGQQYGGGYNNSNYNPYPGMDHPNNGPSNNGYGQILANPTYRRDDMMRNNNENFDSDKDEFENNLDGGLYDQSRNGFIKKVYTLLSLQLLFTVAVCFWAMNSNSFKNIFVNTPMIIIVSVLLMAMSCVIGCCIDVVRKYGLPILIVFTILFSILVGIICSMTKSSIVLTAAGITALIVIGLTIYACVTKSDFTGCGPYLFIISLLILVFGIVLIFWKNPIAHLVYSCLAGLLFCVYLVFDTQMVLGKGKYAYTLDDAYFAAIQLYIDIIEIFLQILRILSIVDG